MMSIYAHDNPPVMNISLPRNSMATTMVQTPPASPSALIPRNVNETLPGWPTLAKTIAGKPDLEAFSAFTDLNIKSLLYYQAQLIYLRKKLHQAEWRDHRLHNEEDEQAQYAEDLETLFMVVDSAEEKDPEQWTVLCRIREVLDKYNNALLQFSQITTLPDADSVNVRSLRQYLKRMGGLTGDGSKTWGSQTETEQPEVGLPRLILGLFTGFFSSPNLERKPCPGEFQEHLIIPRLLRKPDGLTLWVAHHFIPFYHYLWKKYYKPLCARAKRVLAKCHTKECSDVEGKGSDSATLTPTSSNVSDNGASKNLTEYSGNWIVRITSILTTVVACLLPTVAITVLARVHTMGMILGLISLFTAAFAIGLVLLSSSSSRVEIFTASAAFSAVMVVFVQNQISTA